MFSSSNTANSKMPHRSLKTMESRMVVTGHRGFLREETSKDDVNYKTFLELLKKHGLETRMEKDALQYRKKIVILPACL